MLHRTHGFIKLLSALVALMVLTKAALGSQPLPRQETPLRIASFGTSLTARGGWQKPLETALQACLGRPVEVQAVALSGSTSQWGLANVDRVVAWKPDIVLVEFYANDAALNRWTSVGTSRETIAAIFRSLRSGLPHARLLGMAMNPLHGWRGWVRPFLSSYMEAHRTVAEDIGDGYIDFGPRWAELSEAEIAAAIPDGTHPRPEIASRVMVPELLRRLAPGCAVDPDGEGLAGQGGTNR